MRAQRNISSIRPQFTCWFANYTQINPTQFERQRYLVFGYTNGGDTVILDRSSGPVSRRNNLFSIPDPVPPSQVIDFYRGVHLFAFEVRVPNGAIIEWRLANSTERVDTRNLTGDTMCRVKFNLTCPNSGIHNDSKLIRGFCSTVATRFCGRRYLCDLDRCVNIVPDVCPLGFNCTESNLTCQLVPTSPPTASIPPTPVPTPAPTPPTLVTSSPTLAPTRQPTNAPTLAPITPAPTTKAPTTRAPTTRAPTRRPTTSPTPSPTPEPTGLATPSTLNILTRVGTIVALAVAMILVVLFAMVTRRSTTTGRR